MKRGVLVALVVGALVGVRPGPVDAQQLDVRAISLGIGGGVSVPFDAASDAYKTGFNGSAFVRLDRVGSPWAVRVDFSYQNFELRPGVIPAAGLPGGGNGTLLAGLGMAQFYLGRGNLRPYLLAGCGAYAVRTEYDSEALAALSETRFGVRGGAGMLLTLGSLLLYAEGGLDHVVPRSGAAVSERIRAAPLTVGVIF